MKKILPIAAIGAGIYLAYRFLMQKKAALQNLSAVPLSISIDSRRSSETLFSQLFYKVKLKLTNNEAQPVYVRSLDFDVIYKNRNIGKIYKDQDFIVPGRSTQTVEVIASIQTAVLVTNIIDLVKTGFKDIEFTIQGVIVTDLGEIPLRFTKKING